MPWRGLTLVTDADLGNLEPEATHSRRPWGAATWPRQRAEAKRDLKIWLERDFSDRVPMPSVADRVLDRWNPDWVFKYTAAAFSDVTTAARDDNEEDLNLAAALATPASDRIYVGALFEFEGLVLKFLDSVNANASVLTVKYWAGANGGWTALSLADGTTVSGKTCNQTGRVVWTIPADWERRRLNGSGDEYFWVEISVSAALTSGTALTQLLPIAAPDGLKRVATFLALAHIFRGLAAAAADPPSWLDRVINKDHSGYQDRAEELYASLRDGGGIPIDLSQNDAIDPKEETTVRQPLRVFRA